MSKTERALIYVMRDPEALAALSAETRILMTSAGYMADGKLTDRARRFFNDVIEPDLRHARRPAFMRARRGS